MASRAGRPNKRSLLAYEDLERLGVDALKNLLETRELAMQAFKNHRGDNQNNDSGVGYLGLVMKADIEILGLKYAKLSAIAFKDMTSDDDKAEPMSTARAVEVIKNDIFNPDRQITQNVIEAINENREKLEELPMGKS